MVLVRLMSNLIFALEIAIGSVRKKAGLVNVSGLLSQFEVSHVRVLLSSTLKILVSSLSLRFILVFLY